MYQIDICAWFHPLHTSLRSSDQPWGPETPDSSFAATMHLKLACLPMHSEVLHKELKYISDASCNNGYRDRLFRYRLRNNHNINYGKGKILKTLPFKSDKLLEVCSDNNQRRSMTAFLHHQKRSWLLSSKPRIRWPLILSLMFNINSWAFMVIIVPGTR